MKHRQARSVAKSTKRTSRRPIRYTRTLERGKASRVRNAPSFEIVDRFSESADVTLFGGSCLDLLHTMPDGCAKLVVTSPPYNIGKSYEKREPLAQYLDFQESVIEECARILAPDGSICWQVGNFVDKTEVVPLDVVLYPIFKKLGFKLRNRIIWHFEHGLHCSRRFSGRYETVNWFSRSDTYGFNLDPVRVPQKYPNKKHFKGPKAGQLSCNPLGKNPGDVWVIPNVKHNHVEKTIHPCQFPVELVERLVLALTRPSELVFDPFMGAGTSAVAAVLHRRRAAGAEVVGDYLQVARQRVRAAAAGSLRTRPMNRPIYDPKQSKLSHPTNGVLYPRPGDADQLRLLERPRSPYLGNNFPANA